jgi:hypothetical protein
VGVVSGCICQAGPGQTHRTGCPAAGEQVGWTPTAEVSTELVAPELLPVRARVARVWDVAVGDTPSPWSAPQPPMADLVRYAQEAPWCAEDADGWRRAGQAYQWAVAIPVSLAVYLVAWVVQRPARLGLAGLLAGLVAWAVLR